MLEHTFIRVRSACFLHYLLVFIWSRVGTWLEHLCFANTALHAVNPDPVTFLDYLRI
jgi:hypothetical protein